MTHQISSNIVEKSTRGKLWGHMGPKATQKEGPAPLGTQNGGPGALQATIFITFAIYFE